MSNGEVYQVRYPDFAFVLRTNFVIGHPDADNFPDLYPGFSETGVLMLAPKALEGQRGFLGDATCGRTGG